MKKAVLISLYVLYISCGYAQNRNIESLKPGDSLPDLPMAKVLLNGKTISLNSKDYNDRLLILDFWDTWCSSCIESFPKLELLQKTYGNQIQIISATYQNEKLVREFKSRNKLAMAYTLPIMVEDSLFKSYFPYRSVPHTIWINKGKVIAIVGNEYLDKNMINKVLNGDRINLPVKNEYINYDFKSRSILGDIQNDKKMMWSAVTGYRPNVGEILISTTIDSLNGLVKDVFLNKEISRIYIKLLLDLKKRDYILKPDMVIVEAQTPEKYDINFKKANDYTQDWMIRNSICYESVLPANLDKKERARIMLADLDNKLGLNGRMELRPHEVYVIKQLQGASPVPDQTKDGNITGKTDYKHFVNLLFYNTVTVDGLKEVSPIIDEYRQFQKQINLYGFTDLPSLKRMLNLNGLDIVMEIKPIEVFVLSEIRKQ